MDEPGVSGLHDVAARVPLHRIITAQGDVPFLPPTQPPAVLPDALLDEQWHWIRENANPDVAPWGQEVFFHPVYAYGTAAVRGNKRLTKNCVAYWEVMVSGKLFGTSIMFGIGTKKVQTRLEFQFADLLGSDEESYGMNHQAIVQHGGLMARVGRPLPEDNCVVGMLFNGHERTLSYFVNGRFLCTPFVNIDTSKTYYPMVTSTAQQSRFFVQHQKSLYSIPSLEFMSLRKVSESLRGDENLDELPLLHQHRRHLKDARQQGGHHHTGSSSYPNGPWTERSVVAPDSIHKILQEIYRPSLTIGRRNDREAHDGADQVMCQSS